jgi:hypothetical protein
MNNLLELLLGKKPVYPDSLFGAGPMSSNVEHAPDPNASALFATPLPERNIPRPPYDPPSGLEIPDMPTMLKLLEYQRGDNAVDTALEEARLRRARAQQKP